MKGYDLPGSIELVYLLALDRLDTALTPTQVHDAVVLASPQGIEAGSKRSCYNCFARMVARGWVELVHQPRQRYSHTFYQPTESGRAVMRLALDRIDTARMLEPLLERDLG